MKFIWRNKEYAIDRNLAINLLSMVYNLESDFDWVILITGNRTVRVGKSVLAMKIAAFMAHCIEFKKLNDNAFSIKNMYYSGKTMMEDILRRQKFSVYVYDEASEGLSKGLSSETRELLAFFDQVGQMNNIYILVCPDFFSLKEPMAVARAACLINVYIKTEIHELDFFGTGEKLPLVKFKRGNFTFFNRKAKSKLYDKSVSTKLKSYGLVQCDFMGEFSNEYTIDETEYRALKKRALDELTHKAQKSEVRKGSAEWKLKTVLEGLSKEDMQKFSQQMGKPENYFRNQLAILRKKNLEEPKEIEDLLLESKTTTT